MNQKPKIVVIGLKGIPAFGGAATVGENIIRELKNEFDFTVLSTASHTSKKNLNVNGVKQIIFQKFGRGSLNTFYYFIRSLVHVLFNKYDLVHLHHSESGFITPFLRLRYKVLVTFHGICAGTDDPKFSYSHNRFFEFSQLLNIRWANIIVSVSEPNRDYLYNKYKRVIEYIPNGMVIPQRIAEIENKEEKQEYICFSAARIYQIKGLHLLLKAAHSIVPPIKLIVVGDLNQVDKYKTEIEDLSSGLQVQFTGLITNKFELFRILRASKLFVFPSLTEAMSMMLLEAVSMHTPVLASDIPSNKAIFSNDEILFFKNNDSEDLETKLQYAINNPDEMANKARAAFEKLKINFSWHLIAQEYSKIYRNLL